MNRSWPLFGQTTECSRFSMFVPCASSFGCKGSLRASTYISGADAVRTRPGATSVTSWILSAFSFAFQ